MKLVSSLKLADTQSSPRVDDIKVGKDILELLSSSMYVDPMSIYREYIQNAADAIDDAEASSLYPKGKTGGVDVRIDPVVRTISIKDNGAGISSKKAVKTLLAFGGSSKRGTSARGFRGVGRLAGLGYCQELVFRTKATGEKKITAMRWDGRRLKEALRAGGFDGTLAELVSSVVSISSETTTDERDHFFEVTLNGIVRHRNDGLLNSEGVGKYLAEVAPVPFAGEFVHAPAINRALKPYLASSPLSIRIDATDSITRPHREYPALPTGKPIVFKDLETFEIPDIDGKVGAVLWLVHHEYTGAIPNHAGYKGLRFRSGNIQVGDHGLVEDLFAEPRFNQWTIGEVHVIDPRILPNGRRDHFESNIHFDNLRNQLGPIAREISRRCRSSSIIRNALRQFEFHEKDVRENLAILRQGGISKGRRRSIASDVRRTLLSMEKIAARGIMPCDEKLRLDKVILASRKKLEKLQGAAVKDVADPLARFPPAKRAMYEKFFELVYSCSVNQAAAKLLVERMLTKVT
jgi:hypothetical protein